MKSDDEEDSERDDDRENRQREDPRRDVAPAPLPAPEAVRRSAHDFRHAHRTPRVQHVPVRLPPPARVGSAGPGSGPAARVSTAGQTTTAIPSIGHGTHQVSKAGRSVSTLADENSSPRSRPRPPCQPKAGLASRSSTCAHSRRCSTTCRRAWRPTAEGRQPGCALARRHPRLPAQGDPGRPAGPAAHHESRRGGSLRRRRCSISNSTTSGRFRTRRRSSPTSATCNWARCCPDRSSYAQTRVSLRASLMRNASSRLTSHRLTIEISRMSASTASSPTSAVRPRGSCGFP